jgi:hypothetical protein
MAYPLSPGQMEVAKGVREHEGRLMGGTEQNIQGHGELHVTFFTHRF